MKIRGGVKSSNVIPTPYPFFGGKRTIADLVWRAFGDDVANYVSPFFGGGAVELARQNWQGKIETFNDANFFIPNFWRAVLHDPEQTAHYASYPVIEADLHARHKWLLGLSENQEEFLAFRNKMLTDPDYYDCKRAGWWVWGISAWIGHGWCDIGNYQDETEEIADPWKRHPYMSGNGQGINKVKISEQAPRLSAGGQGIHPMNTLPSKQAPYLKSSGQGVNPVNPLPDIPTEQLPFLGHAGRGVARPYPSEKLPAIGENAGRGVNRINITPSEQLPELYAFGRRVQKHRSRQDGLIEYFQVLAARLERVRVCCGDWSRVMGPSVTEIGTINAIFLDPPYNTGNHLYAVKNNVAEDVLEWCKANWHNPKLRIILCGYEGELDVPKDWRCVEWKAPKGYQSADNKDRERERLWLSPACLEIEPKAKQASLFDLLEEAG